jgi:hypothetical protein
MADPVRDFASTASGEWATSNGDFGTVAGAAAVPQAIRIKVGMILGECFLDETIGVDYLGQIIDIKNPDPLVVRALIQAPIEDTPDVTNVVGAELIGPDKDREASIAYQVDTIYSQEPFSGTVEVP